MIEPYCSFSFLIQISHILEVLHSFKNCCKCSYQIPLLADKYPHMWWMYRITSKKPVKVVALIAAFCIYCGCHARMASFCMYCSCHAYKCCTVCSAQVTCSVLCGISLCLVMSFAFNLYNLLLLLKESSIKHCFMHAVGWLVSTSEPSGNSFRRGFWKDAMSSTLLLWNLNTINTT